MDIQSDSSIAAEHGASLQKISETPALEGVDDDNTLAESGIYNTYTALKNTYSKTMTCLAGDGQHIEDAAYLFEDADVFLASSIAGK